MRIIFRLMVANFIICQGKKVRKKRVRRVGRGAKGIVASVFN